MYSIVIGNTRYVVIAWWWKSHTKRAIQRATDHGFLKYFDMRTNRLLLFKQMTPTNKKTIADTFIQDINLYIALQLYVIGSVIGIFVLLIELYNIKTIKNLIKLFILNFKVW